jgi:hypothetical protein
MDAAAMIRRGGIDIDEFHYLEKMHYCDGTYSTGKGRKDLQFYRGFF